MTSPNAVSTSPRPRFLGIDRERAFWILAILALVAAGILLDVFLGSL